MSTAGGGFACRCRAGFVGDGRDCAEKLGTVECYVCDGRPCDSPQRHGLVSRCPYGVYSCQMFVSRE